MEMKYVVALVLSCYFLPSYQTLLDMVTPKAAPAMVAEIMAKDEKTAFSKP